MNRFNCIKCSSQLHLEPSLLNLDSLDINQTTTLSLQNHANSIDESFIVLQSSIPALNQSIINTDEQIITNRAHATESFYDIVNGNSIVNHPLCLQCTEELMNLMDIKRQRMQKDNDLMQAYLDGLETVSDKELDRLRIEQQKIKKQELDYNEVMIQLELENDQLEEEYERLCQESVLLAAEEESLAIHAFNIISRAWIVLNAQQLDNDTKQQVRTDALSHFESTNHQLKILKNSNIYHDTFKIGHDGSFGAINGLRLGRLSSTHVEWKEINAALGLTLFLLDVLAKKVKFEFKNYLLITMGSMSKIEKTTGDRATLELYGQNDLGGILFWNRKLDQALTAFLDCVLQLGDHFEKNDPKFRLPYRIRKNKIGDLSIQLQYNQDDTWTKAFKYTLIDIMFLLSHIFDSRFSSALR